MAAARRILMLAVLAVLLGGAAAYGALATEEDNFYRGLETRGLGTLMEAYLKAKAGAPATATPGVPTAVGGNALALANVEYQKALQARIIGDRDAAFKKAKQYFEQAIAEATQAMKAIPVEKTMDRYNVRLAVLKIRRTLADMIFEHQLTDDLDYLQITDRRAGDRQRTLDLLKVAGDQYKASLEDCRTWMSELDRMDMKERLKYANTFDREIRRTRLEAQYSSDWITYYHGWVLPVDYVPADKERSRKQLLDDAITAFQAYTTNRTSDRDSRKWYAHLVIGMCYRELGKPDEALQSLAIADTTRIANPVEADRLRMRVAYERALTVLRQGNKEEARKVIEEARKTFKEKLDGDLFGIAMNFVEAESYVLEGADKNDATIRKKGFDILRQMYTRPAPFPTIVEQVTKVLGGGGGTGTETGTTPQASNNMEVLQVIGIGGGGKEIGGFEGLGFGGRGLFGVGAEGEIARRIVYVVDRSGSMTDCIDFVKYEMKRSIGELGEDTEFHVIFYSSGPPVEMPTRRLVAATEWNKQLAFEFIDAVIPQGETDPSKALERAFACGAELIYLLTDGEFDKAIVDLVKRANVGNKVTVHAIGFLYRTGEAVLKQIAEQNNGTYKFVSERDLATLTQ